MIWQRNWEYGARKWFFKERRNDAGTLVGRDGGRMLRGDAPSEIIDRIRFEFDIQTAWFHFIIK